RSSGVGASTYEGPARRLHRARFEEIIDDLERNEVEVNVVYEGDPWKGNYTPGAPGKPGAIRVHQDVDIRTLEHEYQHLLDDKAKNFPGLKYYSQNPAEAFEMERRAYTREMDLTRADPSLTPEEKEAIIKVLEGSLEGERVRYLGPGGGAER